MSGGSRGVMASVGRVGNYEALERVSSGVDRRLPPRPNEESPHSSACKPHLKRVCGACPHFSGRLLSDKGQTCARLGFEVNGSTDARACRSWSRKTAGAF